MKSRIILKKHLITITLLFSLGIALFVNWYYTNQPNDEIEPEYENNVNLGEAQYVNSNSISEDDYFKEASLNRKKAHDEAKAYLDEIINSADYDNDTKNNAKESLVSISQCIKTESDIENLVKAQLDVDCLVTYNLDSIEVVLPKDTINDDAVLKIKNIVLLKTNLSTEQISIIELK